MFGLKKVVIAQHERGLYLKNRTIKKIVEPGIYWIYNGFNDINIETYDISQPEFYHPYQDVLIKENQTLCQQYFHKVELTDYEVGYVYQDDKLVDVLAPSMTQLYWRGLKTIRVDIQNIQSEYELDKDKAALVRQIMAAGDKNTIHSELLAVEVPEQFIGLLFIDGQYIKSIDSGLHAYWRFHRKVNLEFVDLRLQSMEVSGQEILTKDRVSLRVNLSAVYRITEPVKARNDVVNVKEFIYRELQFAIREAVGTQLLDTLLATKGELNDIVYRTVKEKLSEHGIELNNVGVKDIILPGDMKAILNQVVETEKAAQANVIKRREETAATRSLLNTAKLMEQNPVLLRLKELEALEKVTEKIDRFTVFGGLDNVLQEVVKIGVRS